MYYINAFTAVKNSLQCRVHRQMHPLERLLQYQERIITLSRRVKCSNAKWTAQQGHYIITSEHGMPIGEQFNVLNIEKGMVQGVKYNTLAASTEPNVSIAQMVRARDC